MTAGRRTAFCGGGMAGLFLISYYVAISARHTIEVFPWRPLGDWRIDSPSGLALLYGLLITGLFALYAAAARAVRGLGPAEAHRVRRLVYGLAAVMMVVLLFAPSLLSRDVFDYMVHGRILALHRANPFTAPAMAFGDDPFVRAMGWPQYTALYGPGWISTCGLLAWIAPGSVAGTLLLYKLLFGAVHVANGLLIGALLRRWKRPALAGEILYLWNPLVLSQAVGQAHNDGFLLLWALLGLLLMSREPGSSLYDEALGTVCMTLSVLVKYVTGPLLLFALVARWRRHGGLRGLGRAAFLGLVSAGVVVVGYMPYARGMDILHFLRPYDHGAYQGGALMLLQMGLHRIMGEKGPGGELGGDLMLYAATALVLLTIGGTILLALRTHSDEGVARHGLWLLFGYVLAVTALLRISYGVWIVALAVLVAPGLVRRAAILFSFSLMALDVFWVYAIRMVESGASVDRQKAAAALVAVGVPVSYLLAGLMRRGRASAGSAHG